MILEEAISIGCGVGNYSPEEVRAAICAVEDHMRTLPLIEVQTTHKFADGLYYREILIPKGCAITGSIHKQADMNIVYYGDMDVLTEFGMKRVIGACSFPGKAGMKQFGIANEDTLWATVHHTHLTDLDEIEKELFEDCHSMFDFKTGEVNSNRVDYFKVLQESGISHQQAQAETENEDDLDRDEIPGVCLGKSDIHGQGMFASVDFEAGSVVGPASINGRRTLLGRYVNHAISTNVEPKMSDNGDMTWVATRAIMQGEEILVDYRKPLACRGRLPELGV